MAERDDRSDEGRDLVETDEVKLGWRQGARRRILQGTAVLPSLLTILNGLAGLGAIHYATKTALGELGPNAEGISTAVNNLRMSVWMIVAALIFDMLDGRLARMTRRTSDFGGQLDSLCDAVSFGVAPAILMTRTVVLTIRQLGFGSHVQIERVVWSIGAVYLACTVMRLARFNVENEPDESAHMDFHGLPSPGAAGVVASLVLLFTRIVDSPLVGPAWQDATWLLIAVSAALPIMTLLAALLMVSNIQYTHLVNHWVHGRRPVSYILKLVILVLAMLYDLAITAAVFANVYALSGPTITAWIRFRSRGRRDILEPADGDQDQTPEPKTEP